MGKSGKLSFNGRKLIGNEQSGHFIYVYENLLVPEGCLSLPQAIYMYMAVIFTTPYMVRQFQMFMSARAFWRVSYFAVFYTEYLNFSWYNLIEAYIFSISIGRIIDNQILQCIYPFILSLGDKNNTPKYRRANVI